MHQIPGLAGSALVTRAGSVRAEFAQGPADIETGTDCTAETRFQLCSVSKQFAAAAALLLVESGQLDLAEPVARWLPAGTPPWHRITLHHLLSHTAGLGHWHEVPGLDPSQPMSFGEQLALIQQAPLRSEPGTQWHYSSPGFLLVGHIVAQASGQPYPEFVAERILSPLSLTSTTAGGKLTSATVGGKPDSTTAGAALFAHGYRTGQPVPAWDLATMAGTGDIWSTAGDLTRFITALHSGALISASSLRAMCATHSPLAAAAAAAADADAADAAAGGPPRLITDGYGYGMFTGHFGGHAAYYHPGDNPGYESFAAWIPDRAASIVILANDEDVSIEDLMSQLLPAALEP